MTSDISVFQTEDKRIGVPGGLAGPGRAKGSVNKTTKAQREFATRVLGEQDSSEFEEFVASTRRQLLAGTLPPAITSLILHYAYGKPKETVEVSGEVTVEKVIREVIHTPHETVSDAVH